MAGAAATALLATIGTLTGVIAESGERTISLYNIHTKETVSVVYKKSGKYVEAGLEKVNHALRDHRRNEATRMDPELIDLLWEIHNELGSREPIHIISGYRSRATNDMLRKSVGGQASESRHILGKAADVHFPDVPVKNLRYSALIRERGGVGYYPTSAIPFVHFDTDRVRSWPRLPRFELAMLFPSGSTKHAAADGGPITPEDVRIAKAQHRDLWTQVAAFHEQRSGGGTAVALAQPKPAAPQTVAALPPPVSPLPAPALVEPPKPVAAAKPSTPTFTPPPAADRARLSELALMASTTPMLVAGPAPARRPQLAAAQPSLTGTAQVPGLAPRTSQPAPKLAAVDASATPAATPAAPLTDATRLGFGGGWSVAPAFDEEHPEELSYRPFPIAPFLTATANEPIMSELQHHDVARTVDMIDQAARMIPLKLRPSEQTVRLLWTQQRFTGEAIGLAKLHEAMAPPANGVQSRPVKTSRK